MSGLWDQLARLPVLLSWHLVLTLLAVGAGLLISLPAGIVAARVDRLRGPLLLLASVIQTIPGLALLALVFAVLVLLREALPERYAFSAIGFWPTIIALTMYSILPILRNTVTGLRGVDPAAVEAGRALGMTGGQASLGDYIFRGIQTFNTTAILVGCISAAILALVLDLLVGRVEAAAGRRRWRRAGVLVGLLFGLGLAGAAVLWLTGHIGGGGRERAVVIGTKNFAEQFVLGHWIEDRLTAAGLPTDRREGLGSMQAFNALAAGDLDVYVDYTGTLWANVLQRDPGPGPEAVLRETGEVLQQEYGITLLGSLGFQNAYALAMRRDDARARGITDIDDLAVHAAGLRLGSDVEFFDRPEWTRLRDTYGLADVRQVSMAPELMYQALQSGDVDLITAFTSDGRIAKFDLELLEDSQSVFPPYDAVLLLSEQAAADPRIVTALRPMLGAVDLEAMQRVNLLVDEGEATPAEAAERLEALVGR